MGLPRRQATRLLFLIEGGIFFLALVLTLYSCWTYYVTDFQMGWEALPYTLRGFLLLFGIFTGITLIFLPLSLFFFRGPIARQQWWPGALVGFLTFSLAGSILTILHGGPPSDGVDDAMVVLEGLSLPGAYAALRICEVFGLETSTGFGLTWHAYMIIFVNSAICYGIAGAILYNLFFSIASREPLARR